MPSFPTPPKNWISPASTPRSSPPVLPCPPSNPDRAGAAKPRQVSRLPSPCSLFSSAVRVGIQRNWRDPSNLNHIISIIPRVPSPNRYIADAKFCFCKNNKRIIIKEAGIGTPGERVRVINALYIWCRSTSVNLRASGTSSASGAPAAPAASAIAGWDFEKDLEQIFATE